ncbi:hypothetical protein MHK_010804 [Candidatus Magnetomorum sp. HK-1]|nr:hypothetical protein MHK_010804 [Candidatus Magnetomorum sp. HK-1]
MSSEQYENFALTGPKGCGKSTFKNAFGGKKISIPVVINKCLGISDLSIETKDTIKGLHPTISNYVFQKQVEPTHEITPLEATIRLESSTQNKKIKIFDFPGEILENEKNKQKAFQKLSESQYILFFVPFWFLLRDDLLSKEAIKSKETMSGYESWTQAFNDLGSFEVSKQSKKKKIQQRELIIILNMFGHRWDESWVNIDELINNKDSSVLKVYESLKQIDKTIYSMEKLETIQEKPWLAMTRYMNFLRILEQNVLKYVEAAHDISGHNNHYARRLINLSEKKFRKTYISINVIDNFAKKAKYETYHLLHNFHRLAYIPLLYLLHGFTEDEVW